MGQKRNEDDSLIKILSITSHTPIRKHTHLGSLSSSLSSLASLASSREFVFYIVEQSEQR